MGCCGSMLKSNLAGALEKPARLKEKPNYAFKPTAVPVRCFDRSTAAPRRLNAALGLGNTMMNPLERCATAFFNQWLIEPLPVDSNQTVRRVDIPVHERPPFRRMRGQDSGRCEATVPGHARPAFRVMGGQCGGRLRVGHPRGLLPAGYSHVSSEVAHATDSRTAAVAL